MLILLGYNLQQHGMGAGLIWMFRTTVKASNGLEEGAKNWGGGTQVVFACWPWRKKQHSLISMTGNSFTTCTKVLAHWGYAPISPCRITSSLMNTFQKDDPWVPENDFSGS